jgi:tellurite resistance protein TehA-like permease
MAPLFSGRWPHIKYEVAVIVGILGGMIPLGVVAILLTIYGLTPQTVPLLVTIFAMMGPVLQGLVNTLKSTEAADTASKTKNVVELTASKVSTIQQVVDTCPTTDCPLKKDSSQWEVRP